jgi:hypothetical protein
MKRHRDKTISEIVEEMQQASWLGIAGKILLDFITGFGILAALGIVISGTYWSWLNYPTFTVACYLTGICVLVGASWNRE